MDRLILFLVFLIRLSLLFICFFLSSPAESVADSVSGHSMTDFQSIPISIQENSTTPQVLISASNDHQLFFKAYNDYSDLDGDGVPETTYKHSVDYYGYFDSNKCYSYTGEERFYPVTVTTDKYCTAGSGQWSGNFLNWATMTRIDTIRKILFGGHRRVDTSSETVLERAFLPPDIHSFAKYYNGKDLNLLTPFSAGEFNSSEPTATASPGFGPVVEGDKIGFVVSDASIIRKNDYLSIGNDTDYVNGFVSDVNDTKITIIADAVGGTATVSASATVINRTNTGITLCNVTYYDSLNDSSKYFSEKNTSPPLIRVAAGNYSLWAAGEVNQCLWEEEDPGNDNGRNYNKPEITGIYAAHDNPLKVDVGLGNHDYVARVAACVDMNSDGVIDDSDGGENCKKYPYGNYKPIGLLQKYGEGSLGTDDYNPDLIFGMIAGTYGKSTSGGDLIMPLFNDDGNGSNMCREINLGKDCDGDGNIDDLVVPSHNVGDGTFKRVFNWVGGPVAKQDADGIINTWSIYRIRGYKYGDWTYGSDLGDKCSQSIKFFGDSSPDECTNWGNPFAEIYLTALRHWVGENVPDDYKANDVIESSVFEGLNYLNDQAEDPLTEDNYCAPLSIINFSTSVISADTAFSENDELDNSNQGIEKDLDSPVSSRELTRQIGKEEGIYDSGTTWFVGETTSDNSKTCTPKAITNFGDVRGLCPEGPGQRGGFRIAGMAWYAHTNDIRSALKGTQKVDNYSVRLSSGSPIIEIPVPGAVDKKVTILPSCFNIDKNYGCTLVDFKIVEPYTETAGTGRGKVLVLWEDSLQGNNYDLDAGVTIEYEITGTKITTTATITYENSVNTINYGYIISGTDSDGQVDVDSSTFPLEHTLVGSSPPVGMLKDPLWYAAKWGGFTDLNDNQKPDLADEWDRKNNKTGESGADGIPDNYFFATQPQELEDALQRTFNAILERTSSGTAAAVSSNVLGEGVLYQAFYEPLKVQKMDEGSIDKEVSWIGTIQALWLDRYGYTRQDCSPPASYNPDSNVDSDGNRICPPTPIACGVPNGKLDDYCIDNVVESYSDELEQRVRVRVFESTNPDTYEKSGDAALKEINELSYLWNGREKLYLDTLTDTKLRENRIFSSDSASTGRYIMTWIDRDYDGEVDSGEYIDFQSSMFTAPTSVPFGFFDVNAVDKAKDVVDYIRGVEISGTRNRTIKYSADDADEHVMRLGDIINSTPTVVGSPQEAFNLLYKDDSYTPFRSQYQNRRTMVYVGANDGLLHAFNGGFYKVISDTVEYSTTATSGEVKHDLGAEMWAYAPGNLLSHLQWLKDPNYAESHVYYIDGKPRVFDANIFTDDADHPNGWGTVLVVGMNLGGGEVEVDTGSNGSSGSDADDDLIMRSAYVIFDITNPEKEPALLGEIQIPDASFSTVYPAVIGFRDTGTDTNCSISGVDSACNKWYLVFGNGPNNMSTYATNQNGKMYLFDLAQLTTSTTELPPDGESVPAGCSVVDLTTNMNIISCDTNVAAAFMGTPVAVDWDLDFYADTLYFGLVGNSVAATGNVQRMDLDVADSTDSRDSKSVLPNNWSSLATFYQTDQPVLVQPLPALDNLVPATKWLFFGTGRYFTSGDKISTATQSLYGIKDAGSSPVLKTNLRDVTNVEVYSDSTITDNDLAINGIATFEDFVDYVDDNKEGWYLNLPPIVGEAGTAPATRNITRSTLLGGILFSSVFQPSLDPCEGEGRSRLYGLYYKTGTALPETAVFGTETVTVGGAVKNRLLRYLDLGTGLASSPTLHSGSGTGEKSVSVFTQLSTGDLVRKSAETVQTVRTGRVSWRDK